VIAAYLGELARALRTRGRTRSRFLAECRAHLTDLAAELGESEAVRAFGDPVAVAAEFDAETATGRSVAAAWSSVVAVLVTGGSTLALIHSADPTANAPAGWALIFAWGAQVAAVCVALVLVHAVRLRRTSSPSADVALLCRRAGIALVAAAITMVAAGAGLTGHGSAAALLAGPLLVSAAAGALLRARRLVGRQELVQRSPFADVRALTGIPVPAIGPFSLAVIAGLAAFVRDSGERGSSPAGSAVVGAIEAALVLASYAALRRPLGLQPAPGATSRTIVSSRRTL
jgi:uncharacterized membrane protein